MTTTTFTGPIGLGTANDAWFRTLQSLSTMLTTLGFPATADTGQVNWATVTIPTDGVYTAYEIRRFNDAAQATDPIYMRIDYYTANPGSAGRKLHWRFTFGTGSNGSGTITGTVGATPMAHLLTGTSADFPTYYASSDGSGFAMLGSKAIALGSNWLLIERARGANGDVIAGQLFVSRGTNGVNSGGTTAVDIEFDHYNFTTGAVTVTRGTPVAYPQTIDLTTSSLAFSPAGQYPFGAIAYPVGVDVIGYSKLMVGYAQADFINHTEFNLTRFTDDEVVRYAVKKPWTFATSTVMSFGIVSTASPTNSGANPVLYATPAIYWA